MKDGNRRTSSHFQINEPLLFEEGSPGRRAFDLPALDVPSTQLTDIVDSNLLREGLAGMPVERVRCRPAFHTAVHLELPH
jgi:hypothetical protein